MQVFRHGAPCGLSHIDTDIEALGLMGRPKCDDTVVDNGPQVAQFTRLKLVNCCDLAIWNDKKVPGRVRVDIQHRKTGLTSVNDVRRRIRFARGNQPGEDAPGATV